MDTVAARIATQTAADLQQVGLDPEERATRIVSFDWEGRPVAADSDLAVFRAFISDNLHTLAGSSATNLRRVTLQVADDPSQRINSVDASGYATIPPGITVRTFQFYVHR